MTDMVDWAEERRTLYDRISNLRTALEAIRDSSDQCHELRWGLAQHALKTDDHAADPTLPEPLLSTAEVDELCSYQQPWRATACNYPAYDALDGICGVCWCRLRRRSRLRLDRPWMAPRSAGRRPASLTARLDSLVAHWIALQSWSEHCVSATAACATRYRRNHKKGTS